MTVLRRGSARSNAAPPLSPKASLRWDVVERIVVNLQPKSVLEVGCGRGAAGARLARLGDYVGVEPDEASFEAAHEAISRFGGTVVQGTTQALGRDRTFDLVCAFEVLEHIEDDEAAVAEWVEMIKPGGSLLLSVPAYSRRFAPMDVMAGHFRRYDPGQLARIFTQFGLVDVTERFYSWPLGYLLEVVRNRIDARRIREEQGSAAEHTAASGRTLQPASRVVGALIAVGISPFRWLQRLRPMSGPGLIVVGRRAE